jgi:hypothetical protein
VKTFSIAEILTVVHGPLLCEVGRIYDFLNYMTGDNLMTHQLPRAADQCTPALREQFPDLAALVLPILHGQEEVTAYLEFLVAEHGETREVAPLAEYTPVDPIKELIAMRGGDSSNIIVVGV